MTTKAAANGSADGDSEPQEARPKGGGGGSRAGGPGRPGGGCRCGPRVAALEDAQQLGFRLQRQTALALLVVVFLCIWNDWDIRRLSAKVARGAGN